MKFHVKIAYRIVSTNESDSVAFSNTYGCESWTLRKNEETRMDAFEMKGLRTILRVSWTAKKTNEWVLNKAGVKRELLHTFKAKKLAYLAAWRSGYWSSSMNEVNARRAWQTEQQSSVAVTSSSSTMTYLAQYMMYLPSRAEQTPAEFWRQRDNGSVIPLVALDLISAHGFAGILVII